jgi:hypothetical protein
LGVEYITTKFNANTRKNIHVITIYKPSTTIFKNNMLDQNSTHLKELENFMKHYSMELQFKEITTIYGTHINHI